jgi:hypothetical protein
VRLARPFGGGPQVAEVLQDPVHRVGGLRFHGQADEGRRVVGLADVELEDLEIASAFDDPRERLAQDVGVDEVAFHRDGFFDHRGSCLD